jgi:glyoxylase-like metal-dependent hydrolase (beta-lactamase superfamily II)
MLLRTLPVGRIRANCYVLVCERTRAALVIDPGDDLETIQAALASLNAQVSLIALTHYHFDHVLAADGLRRASGAQIAIHRADAALLAKPPALFRFLPGATVSVAADRLLEEGDKLAVGDLTLEVLATPGHTPGGVSFWLAAERLVFTGDTLFREGVGRTDFPGSDSELLLRSIRERLFALPDATLVYPGHGPQTTIGHERLHNPWAVEER